MRGLLGFVRLAAIGLPVLFAASAAEAQSGPPTAEELPHRLATSKKDYEKRIAALEAQLAGMKARPPAAEQKAAPASRPSMRSGDNSFNPAIGVVLNAMFVDRSDEEVGLPGFQLGHESERPEKGFSLGHSEVTMSGNIDDKFRGALTLGLGAHGSETEVELEEAYIQTLAGSGMPDGFRLKAGGVWTWLPERAARAWRDFADLSASYKASGRPTIDDGAEFPSCFGHLYKEVGGGIFRGGDTPFGGSEAGRDARSVYARLGGDLTGNSALRVGAYMLDGEARNRTGGDPHAHEEEAHAHEEEEHAHEEGEEGEKRRSMPMPRFLQRLVRGRHAALRR